MKIVGLNINKHSQVAGKEVDEYVLNLFDRCQFDYFDVQNYLVKVKNSPLTPSSIPYMYVVFFDFNKHERLNDEILNHLQRYERPVFFVFKNASDESLCKSYVKELSLLSGIKSWGIIALGETKQEFDTSLNQIRNVSLRLKLIRKVNKIQYQKMKLRGDGFGSCGIDRSANECGDAQSC